MKQKYARCLVGRALRWGWSTVETNDKDDVMTLHFRSCIKVICVRALTGLAGVLLQCCMVLHLRAQTSDVALSRLYAVQSGFERVGTNIRIPRSPIIARFTSKVGLFWLDLDSLTGRYDNDGVDELALQDYFFPAASGRNVITYARSAEVFTFLIRPDNSIKNKAITCANRNPQVQHNAPYGPDTSGLLYAPDLSQSVQIPRTLRPWNLSVRVDSALFLLDTATYRVHCCYASRYPQVHPTPMQPNPLRHLVTDGTDWYGVVNRPAQPRPTQHLVTFRLGELVTRDVDSMEVDGERTFLRPESMVRMWADSILYCDSTGFFGILRQGRITTVDLPIAPDRVMAEQEGVFLFQRSSDSVRIAFTDRSTWPRWRRWSYHIDFDRFANPGFDAFTLFGDLGYAFARTYEPSTLVSSPAHPYPFELGCLPAQDAAFVPVQRMLVTWHGRGGLPMVVSDQGCMTRIVRPGFGYVTHPLLLHDDMGTRVRDMRAPANVNGTLPWTGVRRPHAWSTGDGDTLVHTGAVVRRLHRNGDMLDTLAATPAQAWCRLDAERWAHANHRAVTIVGPTGSATVEIPYDFVQLRPGYASSLTPLLDGSLLVSYYGAVRTDTNQTAQPYRRGGMVRLRADSTTTTVTLPTEAGSYIYPVHRMDDGTLLAMSATFTDDTLIGADLNQQYLDNVRVLRSTDDGATWRASAQLFYNGPWVPATGRFLRTGPQTILGVMPTSIIVSTDNGSTWDFDARFEASLAVCDIDIASDTMLLATQKGLYRYVETTSSAPDAEPEPHRGGNRTMTREAFQAMVAESTSQDGDILIFDLLGRRILDARRVPHGTMVFVRSRSLCTSIYVE
jgi:hypothetical protein